VAAGDRLGALAGQWVQALLENELPPEVPQLVQPGLVVVRQSTTLTAVDDADLRRALHYLRENAGGEVTIESLCAALRLSRRSLERKFAASLRCTPWEMLCRVRTQTAKRLLVETDLPMTLIAERSGFADPARFSVVFRREIGKSPNEFRRFARGVGT